MPTARQKKILELIPPAGVLADVGCDHGIIGCRAYASGKAREVVFIDISRESLSKAEKLWRLTAGGKGGNGTKFLCQNGLGDVKADCAVIAGMGGMEIIEILKGASELPEKLVLQPMKNADKLRIFAQNFYKTETDYLFYDGKYYNLMYLTKGGDKLTEAEISFGRTNLSAFSEDFRKYLRGRLRLCDAVLKKCDDPDVKRARENITRLLEKGEIDNDR